MSKFYGRFLSSLLLFAGLVLPSFSHPLDIGEELVPYAHTTHKSLDEVSGITRGVRYPDLYWVHNDSGDKARIFAIDINGNVILPEWKRQKYLKKGEEPNDKYKGLPIHGAFHYDWEDITMLDDMIVIADTGNNGNARRDLALYFIKEPNPRAVTASHILKRIPIAYPEQTEYPPTDEDWQYDCESIFASDGKIYLLSKVREMNQLYTPIPRTTLYRLDTLDPHRTNVLTKVDTIDGLGGWVTAASLSPDGQHLAVLCKTPTQSVWLFKKPAQGDKWLSSESHMFLFHGAGECEAITFENNDSLIIINEAGEMYRLDTDTFVDMQRNTGK